MKIISCNTDENNIFFLRNKVEIIKKQMTITQDIVLLYQEVTQETCVF